VFGYQLLDSLFSLNKMFHEKFENSYFSKVVRQKLIIFKGKTNKQQQEQLMWLAFVDLDISKCRQSYLASINCCKRVKVNTKSQFTKYIK